MNNAILTDNKGINKPLMVSLSNHSAALSSPFDRLRVSGGVNFSLLRTLERI
jgi:hypothetical protein